jgi:putative Ca2+/H+ antiporter (TMEM165/GDT1 family)
LTVIPESDISREDSVFNEDNLLTVKKKDTEESEGSGYLLNQRGSTGFKLNLLNKKKDLNSEINDKKTDSFENEIKLTDGDKIVIEDDNEHNIDCEIDNKEDEEGEEENKKKKPDLFRSRSRYALDYLDKNVNTNQPNIDSSIFGTIFWTICLSEFGDRTQLISLTASSIFHFFGSILGSCLALFCSCLIGVYFSRSVMKIFKQKIIDFLLGAIFLGYGIQIYLTKKYSQSAQPAQMAPPV